MTTRALKNPLGDPSFVEQEFFKTYHALFNAKSVREARFLQKKLRFLAQVASKLGIQMNKYENGNRY